MLLCQVFYFLIHALLACFKVHRWDLSRASDVFGLLRLEELGVRLDMGHFVF